jgi:flagellar motility protein MotE (MotC chaperone)
MGIIMIKANTVRKNIKSPAVKKVPRKLLLRVIRQKYDTLDELGKKLGISKQSVSDALNRQTEKFMQRLTDKAGIDLSALNNPEISDTKFGNQAQQEMEELKRDLRQKSNYIDRLENEIKELKEMLYKNKKLKHLEKLRHE